MVDNLNISNISCHIPLLRQCRIWWRFAAGLAGAGPDTAFGGGAPVLQPAAQSPASGHGSGGVDPPRALPA